MAFPDGDQTVKRGLLSFLSPASAGFLLVGFTPRQVSNLPRTINMNFSNPLFQTNLTSLPLIGRGKVRDIYAVGTDYLLMVACDRLSAFDVVMNEPIPEKGKLLTAMTQFWFQKLAGIVPNHLTGLDPKSVVDNESDRMQIVDRSVVVKRLRPISIEAVVRGYIAGSAWTEYNNTSIISGIQLPINIENAGQLPEPIFTPAIKAQMGEHDRNIQFQEMRALIGNDRAERIKEISLELYRQATALALPKGIIIADTKFEFGTDASGNLILMDEILTPDSSRFWPVETYATGLNPPSFDKQFIRDWLENYKVDGKLWDKKPPAPPLPFEIRMATSGRYQEALKRLIG